MVIKSYEMEYFKTLIVLKNCSFFVLILSSEHLSKCFKTSRFTFLFNKNIDLFFSQLAFSNFLLDTFTVKDTADKQTLSYSYMHTVYACTLGSGTVVANLTSNV